MSPPPRPQLLLTSMLFQGVWNGWFTFAQPRLLARAYVQNTQYPLFYPKQLFCPVRNGPAGGTEWADPLRKTTLHVLQVSSRSPSSSPPALA